MYTDLVGHSTKQGAIIQDKLALYVDKKIFWLTAKVDINKPFQTLAPWQNLTHYPTQVVDAVFILHRRFSDTRYITHS